MRQAGTLSSKHDGDRFASYLLTLGIPAKVEPAGGEWAVWVRDENQVTRSKEELDRYRTAPADPRYEEAERQAKAVLREAAQKARKAQKNYVDMREQWSGTLRRRPVTMMLIVASVLVTLQMELGQQSSAMRELLAFWMPDIVQGQVWRLLTPIFMHFSFLHLAFNMWWLYDLGTLIEVRLRSARYALLVLVIAMSSNYGQYLMSGPGFGGMSGVVYGLFGYAWVRGRLDPASGLYLRPDVAFWMMAWFFLCLVGPVGNVANTAHGVGLAAGAALGYLAHVGKFPRLKT